MTGGSLSPLCFSFRYQHFMFSQLCIIVFFSLIALAILPYIIEAVLVIIEYALILLGYIIIYGIILIIATLAISFLIWVFVP